MICRSRAKCALNILLLSPYTSIPDTSRTCHAETACACLPSRRASPEWGPAKKPGHRTNRRTYLNGPGKPKEVECQVIGRHIINSHPRNRFFARNRTKCIPPSDKTLHTMVLYLIQSISATKSKRKKSDTTRRAWIRDPRPRRSGLTQPADYWHVIATFESLKGPNT